MQIIQSIQNRIYEIRGERVMLDRDLAALYETETKALNLAVKRNMKRFPADFMFQLTKEEFEGLRFQIETIEESEKPLRLQNETLKMGRGQHSKYMPYAFTEQGVAMLSGVLNSDKAITMNIAIMRAFVEIRRILFRQNDLKEQMKEIKKRLGEHDAQLNHIYDAMENLLDEKAGQRKWEERDRIGFKKDQ
jgi:phage regulator Rha-like protein